MHTVFKPTLFIAICLLLLICPAQIFAQAYKSGELIVQFHPGQTPEALSARNDALSQQALARLDKVRTQTNTLAITDLSPANARSSALTDTIRLITFDPSQDITVVKNAYERLPEINTTELNYRFTADLVPDDTHYPNQWHLHQINLEESWDITTGSSQVVVAVIDTGIDKNHTDIPAQRILAGYDFVNEDNDPADDHGHGTFVGGITAAQTNNALGISATNWQVTLLPYKVLDAESIGYSNDVISAIKAATAHPSHIINLSLAVNAPCHQLPSLQSTINTAYLEGISIVASAGNDNADAAGQSPVSCDNVIGVGATDYQGDKTAYSNYGAVVDIAAPGGAGKDTGDPTHWITSTWLNDQIYWGIGTSYSAPHVSGAIALLVSYAPYLTPEEITSTLINSATPLEQDIGPLLNVHASLESLISTPSATPTSVTTLTADLDSDGDVDILDYALFLPEFGVSDNSSGDLNGDSRADIFDYTLLLDQFGLTQGE